MDDHDHDMCDGCHGDPDTWHERMLDYIDSTKDKIIEHGWVVQAVFPSEDSPGWSYTIGLRELGHAEIIVVNLPHQVAHSVLNTLGDRIRDGETFEVEQLYDKIISNYAVLFREVPDPKAGDWFNVATWIYGDDDWPALQLWWPDKEGHFPWQDGYDTRFAQDMVGV